MRILGIPDLTQGCHQQSLSYLNAREKWVTNPLSYLQVATLFSSLLETKTFFCPSTRPELKCAKQTFKHAKYGFVHWLKPPFQFEKKLAGHLQILGLLGKNSFLLQYLKKFFKLSQKLDYKIVSCLDGKNCWFFRIFCTVHKAEIGERPWRNIT